MKQVHNRKEIEERPAGILDMRQLPDENFDDLWNSIILDRTIPRTDIERMIAESYELTKPKAKKIKK